MLREPPLAEGGFDSPPNADANLPNERGVGDDRGYGYEQRTKSNSNGAYSQPADDQWPFGQLLRESASHDETTYDNSGYYDDWSDDDQPGEDWEYEERPRRRHLSEDDDAFEQRPVWLRAALPISLLVLAIGAAGAALTRTAADQNAEGLSSSEAGIEDSVAEAPGSPSTTTALGSGTTTTTGPTTTTPSTTGTDPSQNPSPLPPVTTTQPRPSSTTTTTQPDPTTTEPPPPETTTTTEPPPLCDVLPLC